jgi:hypothetical protein
MDARLPSLSEPQALIPGQVAAMLSRASRGSGGMSEHRYPASSVYSDYGRVAFGLAVTLVPLLLVDLPAIVAALFAALAALFGWFGWRTWLRQQSWIELSPEAIALRGPFGRRLDWHRLERLKLAYYAPRRSRQDGWMQLTLRGAGGPSIRIDSTLEGFDRVLERAAGAVVARSLPLDPASAANLSAMGYQPRAEAAPNANLTGSPPQGAGARASRSARAP